MSGFFWNVRGLNKSSKHSVIKKWVNEGSFHFGCLLETRVKEGKVQRLGDKLFKDWSVLTNYEYNSRGRIWVVWTKNVRMTPFYKSSQIITCSVKIDEQEEEFFCSFIYASNFMEDRKELWSDLRDHYDSPIFRNKPWIMFGDFNETLDMAEHSRVDILPQVTTGMRDFQALVNYCSLSDMAYQGPLYTWCNKRENDLIMKKLDRVMINEKWAQIYTQSYNVFEAGGCSDHLRSRININVRAGREVKRKPFKFINVVTELEEFKPMVDTYWKETEPIFMSTSTLFRFSKKLKALKPSIQILAKSKIGNLEKKAKEAYKDLCQKQEVDESIPNFNGRRE